MSKFQSSEWHREAAPVLVHQVSLAREGYSAASGTSHFVIWWLSSFSGYKVVPDLCQPAQ